MTISVIVPAYNEEKHLGETLKSIQRAKEFLLERNVVPTDIVVVDNDSSDSTSDVALAFGASVVKETKHNVARAQNAGASFPKGKVLVFIDADTIVPEELLWRINHDESLYMGEDVDFYWRMKQLAKRRNAHVSFIEDIKVFPSTRRFDQWPVWRTLICTNPVYVWTFRRNERAWRGWYKVIPR